MNPTAFIYQGKFLFRFHFWGDNFAWYNSLVWQFFFQHFEYITLLSPGLQGFHWEIPYQFYGDSLLHAKLLLSCCFQNSLCLWLLRVWLLHILVKISLNLISWVFMDLDFHFFSWLGKFSVIIFLNKLSTCFSCSASLEFP